ncbi:MAG: LOG family protein [Verrucomicrobia bacterium]|nr:MAG: LOG family protein [Verrucomicrobiota bacterium]
MEKPRDPAGVPMERDFTAGLAPPGRRRSFAGSTGNVDLDQRIGELVASIPGLRHPELLVEMMITGARTARMDIAAGEFKLFNRVLKEMRRAEEVFKPWRNVRKVSVFGSARTHPEEPEYKAAVAFSRRMREVGFMTITGAGPGIMAAGNEGAGRAESFGLNIVLPFEAVANEFIAGDDKLLAFHYFFTRKLSFVKESDALVGFPGGFGTMDEVFESLTLIQTGKSTIHPIVLIDAKGGTYWEFWARFLREHLLRLALISEADLGLFKVTDDIEAAVTEITGFYRVFHSYRYVGDQLVMRLTSALAEGEPARLQEQFADLLKSGGIIQRGALDAEADEPEMATLPRLVFRHHRRNFGRLRQFIDAVNLARIVAC